MTANEANNNNQSYKRRMTIVVVILIFTNLIWLFLFLNSRSTYQQKEEVLIEDRDQAIAKIDELETELDDKIMQIEELGGDIAELTALKQELEEERDKLEKSNNWNASQLRRFKNKVEGYEELLRQKDDEIVKLKEVKEQLLSENTGLKTEKEELIQEKSDLELTKQNLEEKVMVASQLKAENIRVFALNKRGKEREGEFKARQADKLKIDFTLAENKVAPVGGRDVLIRILEPEGNVLFDVANGSGTFMYDGREMFFTQKQNILYDRTRKDLSYIYDKGSEFKTGLHKLEVYADNLRIGSATFTVK